MTPFTYPTTPHTRRHGPQGYADYSSYRPWLRDDFDYKCVYCLLREQWGRIRGVFNLDHFLPSAHHAAVSRSYDNLVYSCVACNEAKADETIPDPCRFLLDGDVQVREDGVILARTRAARRLVRVLGLDDPEMTEFRLTWIGIIALAQHHDPQLHRRLLGFPEDLPDLKRLRPPVGNQRPEGLEQSWHARRARGELPEIY